jgi:DNA-binding LacI/PurR family transcriptional regulator
MEIAVSSQLKKNARKTQKKNSGKPKKTESNLVGRVTSYDVALHAGVSQSAVSRCFKTGASVSKKMRDRVMKSVKELGYQPNAIARGLITQRSSMIAVIIANLRFYPEVLVNLNRNLISRGLNILLFSLEHESDAQHVVEQIWQYRVDGVIAAANLPVEQIEVLTKARIPVVFLNRSYQDLSVSSVSCDHVAGERILIDLLVKDGYKSFGIISGPVDSVVSRERTTGATDRLDELGFTDHAIVYGNLDYESAGAALHELYELRGNKLPEAIICANDMMAIGCIDEAARRYGMNVPQDLAVVGYDGAAQASWLNYDLVTIRQPLERMTEAAVSIITDHIDNPELPPERRMFLGSLVKGSSAI